MKAFHDSLEIKSKYLNRVMAHAAADRLIQGTGWKNGKGCAVGCTLEAYDHRRYPVELGIPEWLARVEDTIFEGLPKEKAAEWPTKFLSAIHVGADLEKIKSPFLIFVLESALTSFDHANYPDVKKSLDNVIALYKNPNSTNEEFRAASWAAWAAEAAEAASWAAWAAARAAEAASWAAWAAARAAEAAARAAEAAARAAEAAARAAEAAAARTAKAFTYEKFADKLLELLGNCR